MDWHSLPVEKVVEDLHSDALLGLNQTQIENLQKHYGKNTFGPEKKFQFVRVFLFQFKNPLIYLLLLASAIAFTLNEAKDSVVILIVVFANAIFGFLQEFKADKSLRELNRLVKVGIRVIRSGKESIISSTDLLPGDITLLSSGDIIPADIRIIDAFSAKVNEAVLTGESVSVQKNSNPVLNSTILPEISSMIFSGTILVTGRIKGIVVATSLQTEMGKIANLTKKIKEPLTPLEFKIKKFSHHLLFFSLFVFIFILFVGYFKHLPFSELLLVAISQVVSLVPEGLPVAMTIASAVGIRRMAQKHAIVRKLSSIESLGSITIICTDKTGTITENKMKVLEVVGPDLQRISDGDIFTVGVLCNDGVVDRDSDIGDPTETSIIRKAEAFGVKKSFLDSEWKRVNEIPFCSENKFMMTEHLNRVGFRLIALKGAVQQVLGFCSETEIQKMKILDYANSMAMRGLRVLAFAKVKEYSINDGLNLLRNKFEFLGLMGQMDPPRQGVKEAIESCRSSGIQTLMITGDHKLTAISVGKRIGLYKAGDIAIDGEELNHEPIDFSKIKIISRVKPEQKLNIVEKLQENGHVVAMTGDGVNDAPALAKADVGIAMGITGTEVSKQASKIVLANDHFVSIVEAIKEGRLVYKNIKKIILLLFSTSLAELIILILALLLGFPAPFLAVQILWNNLVTEGVITVNLIMDPLEGNEMDSPPIKKDDPLITKIMWKRMLLIVPTIVCITLGWFIFRLKTGVDVDFARTETMTLLVLCEWFNVLNCRSEFKTVLSLDVLKNKWLIWGLILGNFLHVLVIFWRPLGDYFYTRTIDLKIVPILALLASLVLIIEELRKYRIKKVLIP